jgi:hypothetical protein
MPATPARAAPIFGFIRDPSGALTFVDTGTIAAVNNAGQTAGTLYLQAAGNQGFLRDASGTVTLFGLSGGNVTGLTVYNLNNSGQVAGSYGDTTSVGAHGFIRDASGTFMTFDAGDPAQYAGSGGTLVFGLNNLGQAAGTVRLVTGDMGFIRSTAGAITTFNAPGAFQTDAGPINDAGQVAGTYEDASGSQHGFLRSASGAFTLFDITGSTSLVVRGMNQAGEVVGFYTTDRFAEFPHGFLRDPSGTITSFDVPGALSTFPEVINNLGEVAGYFEDANRQNEVFLRDASGAYTMFTTGFPLDTVDGLNDSGQIVGNVLPEPGSTLLLGVGGLGLLLHAWYRSWCTPRRASPSG